MVRRQRRAAPRRRRRPHKGRGLKRYRPRMKGQGVGAIMAGLSLLPLLFK